jgi:hypothetical protein
MKWFCLITTALFLIFAGIDRHQLDLFGMIWNLALSLSQFIGLAAYQVIDEIKKRKEE